MTNRIESGVDVDVPVSTVYNQWTQFEDFPKFMKHVKSVRQQGDKHLHWTVELGGKTREFDAEIDEQIPDKRIAWHATGGLRHAGVVTFHRISDSRSRVMVQLEYEPQGVVENVGSFFGVPKADLDADLERFVEFIEKRGRETGAWRGAIPGKDDVVSPQPRGDVRPAPGAPGMREQGMS